MLGHSLQRDGLSPIPTDHRDGLGSAPRPPLYLEADLRHFLDCAGTGIVELHSGPCGFLALIAERK